MKAKFTPGMSLLQPLLYCRGRSQLIKIFTERCPCIFSFRVVVVVSVLAKVNTVLIRTHCLKSTKHIVYSGVVDRKL
jgi:hypothetical protein